MSVLDDFKLDGRVAIVTGATRGLGKQFALSLAEAGADVIIHGRDEEKAQLVKAEVELRGRKAWVVLGEITDANTVADIVDLSLAMVGQIDILVNNAGACIHGDALEVTYDQWHHVIDTNVNALWYMCQTVGRHMLEVGKGSIINIGSMSGFIVNRPQMQPAYNSSKAAVHHLTHSLAAEWAAKGVRVNALAPGYIKTAMSPVDEPRFKQHWIDDAPMKRYGLPEEIGPAIVFIASDASRFMTGSVLVIDGGYSLF